MTLQRFNTKSQCEYNKTRGAHIFRYVYTFAIAIWLRLCMRRSSEKTIVTRTYCTTKWTKLTESITREHKHATIIHLPRIQLFFPFVLIRFFVSFRLLASPRHKKNVTISIKDLSKWKSFQKDSIFGWKYKGGQKYVKYFSKNGIRFKSITFSKKKTYFNVRVVFYLRIERLQYSFFFR